MNYKLSKLPLYYDIPEEDINCLLEAHEERDALLEEAIWGKNRLILYVHIPFCSYQCFSCPCYKPRFAQRLIEKYIDTVKRELALYSAKPYIKDYKISTIYFGGATPTSIGAENLTSLIRQINDEFDVEEDVEISIEVTPPDISPSLIKLLIDAGVTRFSVNIGSFNDNEIENMNRKYSGQQAVDIVKMIQASGVAQLNIDLLYGLPDQTLESWYNTLSKAKELAVDNIGVFRYFLFEQKQFAAINSKPIHISPDFKKEHVFDFFKRNVEILEQAGYNQIIGDGFEGYSGILFSKKDRVPRYYQDLWCSDSELIGIGMSALGKLRNHWYINESNFDAYIRTIQNGHMPIDKGMHISKIDEMRRRMIFGMKWGKLLFADLKNEFGKDIIFLFKREIDELLDIQLIKLSEKDVARNGIKGLYYIENIAKTFYENKYRRFPQILGQALEVKKWTTI